MHIVYVVRQVDSAGGRERVLTHKANYLARVYGHRVTIVTMFQQRDGAFFPLDPAVQVRHLRLKKPEAFGRNPLAFRRYVRAELTDCLRDLAPDITISMWWGLEFKLLPGIPFGGRKIAEQHFSQFMRDRLLTRGRRSLYFRLRVLLSRLIENRSLRKYDAYVVLTHEDRAAWQHHHLEVIPNPLTLVTDRSSDCSHPVVLAVGRLDEQKGFDRLLRIWSTIEARYPEWRLVIRGDGEDREALNGLIRTLGLTRAAVLPATSQIQEEMLQASILAFTSRYEGFGLVLTEAMQCGLPIVSYDTKCGPRDIIEDGRTGFLVREDDEPAFAGRLAALMESRERRLAMGAAGKQASAERFGDATVMQQWQRLFEQVLNRRPAVAGGPDGEPGAGPTGRTAG